MKKILLMTLMLLTMGVSGFAQSLSDYIMTTGTDATKWETLSSPTTILELGTSTSGDGKASAVTNIGFTFNFAGTDYTQFSVNSDGNLRFGPTVTGTTNYSTPFSSSNANINNPKINMLGCDGYITDSGFVHHQVIGTAPDRVCVIEFATSTYSTNSRNSLLRWQVQLFETSNEIQIVYPSQLPPILPAVARQPGMCVNNSNIILIDANHNASFLNAGSSTNQVPTGTWPDVDRYYHFTIADCSTPSAITVSNITPNSVDVTWGAPAGASSFILEYKPANGTWDDDAITTNVSGDTNYTLTGLTPNTYYDVRVANDCGTEQSGYISTTIHTGCVAISVATEPYFEGFEGYASYSFPDCWTRISGYSTTSYDYPYINNSATNAHSGGGYFYANNNATFPIVVALPDFTEDINTLRLNFWMKPVGTTSSYGQVEVGVMTDLSDISTFHALKTWTAVGIGSSTWAEYTVDFDTVTPSSNDHIVIIRRLTSGTTAYGWYFDDIKVMPIPTCEAPTELAVVNATTNSVDLFWNPGESSTFTVYYRAVGETVYQSETNVSLDADSIYTLTNLDPATNYQWYVASDCGDGTETASNPSVFATTMVPESLPYSTDFGASSDQAWLLNNGNCGNYWVMGTIPDTTASALYITNDGSTPAYTVASTISTVSAAKLFTVGDDAQFQISFDVMMGGESFYDYIKLFFSPATELYPASTVAPTTSDYGQYAYSQYAFDFSDYASLSTYTSATTYPYRFNLTGGNVVHIDAIMPNPNENPDANSTAQVVFVWKNDGTSGTQPGAIIFNVTVSPVSCPSPENLTVTNLDAHSAALEWDEDNTVNNWTVEYGAHGFAIGSGTEIAVSGTPEAIISNLTASTSYDVYVRSNCSDGSVSINTFMSFTTPCEPLTTLPYTQNFDNISGSTSGTTNNLPDCWKHFCNSTSSSYVGYPIVYNSSTYSESGTNSLRFYTYVSGSTSYGDQIAVLPMFDPTLYPVNTLQISFDARIYSTSYPFNLLVGVMSNPTDATTFVAVDTITPSTTTYQNYEIPLSQYTGTGNFIALMVSEPASSYDAGFVDNIVVDLIPNCPKPTHFQAAGIASTSVDLTWTEVGTATEWEIEYGPAGFTPGGTAGTVETVTTEPPYTIAGLTANTAYDFYIRANCGNEYSAYAPVLSLSTACDAINSVPWSDYFDTYGTGTTVYPSCWGKINTYTSGDRPYISTTNYSAPGAMYFYAGTSSTYNIAVTPPFDASIPINTLQATFMYKGSSSTDRLIVGVMSNPADASTFVAIDTIVPGSTASTWVEREVIFSQYTGSGQYIAFKNAYTSTSAYAYLDNLVVDLIPACPKPTQLHAVSTTTTSIELGWTENGSATSWEIEYGPAGFTPGTGNVEYVSTNPYTIGNLSASSVYDFYVISECGSDLSDTSTVFTAATACDVIDQLPYVNGFDAYGTGTTVYPTCWGKINTYTSGDRPYVNATHYAGVGSLYFYAGTSGTYNIAITPEFDATIDINTLQASFMFRATNATDRLIVGVMTNPTDASTFVPVDTIAPSSTAANWVEKEVVFSQYTGTGHYIAFKCAYTTAAAYSYIDNLVIGLIPDCPKPNQIHVVSSTSTSLELGWTENGTATSWEIEYGPIGFVPGTGVGTIETAQTNPYTISNLSPATFYDFYISSDCGASMSPQSFVFTTATECEAIDTLPFVDGFDTYGTGTTAYPLCWGRINTYSADRPYVNSTCYAGAGSLYFYATSPTYNIAIVPQFDATIPVNTLNASFMYRASSSANDRLIVGVMTNPNDASTFVAVDTVYPASTASSWVEREVSFNSYTGTGQYIAFYNGNPSATCYSYIDNLVIDLIPTCPKPSHVNVTAITDNSATLSWTAGGSETSWEIAYGPAGFDPDGTSATVIPANTNPFTVQNLTPATPYEFYVRANCSATEQSPWSTQSASGVTQCSGSVALPYTEDFEGYTGTVYNDPNGIAPACWTTSSNNATYGPPHITGSGSYHYVHSGTNCMVFTCSSAGSDAYAALPTFNGSLNSLTLNFWRAMESTSQGTLTVGYVTNLTDLASSFVTVATIPSVGSTAGDTISVDFTAAGIPTTGNICFHWTQASTFYSCCIDDINVTSNGSAPVITDPTVATNPATGITQTAATLNGTITNPDNVTITAKGFQWKATTGGTYTQIAGTGTGNGFTADLTNLTPNTSYTYKAFITFNGTTVYGSEQTFTTLQQGQATEPSATTAAATNVMQTTATLNGSISNPDNVTITAQGFEWKQTSASSFTTVNATGATMSAPLTGLTANTNYTFRAFVTTANGTHYGADMTFTTLEEQVEPCDVPTGLHATDIQNESIAIAWDANPNVSSWNIQYKPVGGTYTSATSLTNSYTLTGLTGLTNYEIQVQAVCANGTSDWCSAITVQTTNVGIENWLENSVVLFPNPAKEYVDIRIDGELNVTGMEVYDVYGKLINTVGVCDTPVQTRINVSTLANGMYFVRVTTNEGVVTKTFVKR